MPGHYNDNWEWVNDEDPDYTYTPPSQVAPEPILGQLGVPINSPDPAGTQNLAYWQSRGFTIEDMFTPDGQMRPGWSRTANGYEYHPPAALTNTNNTNTNTGLTINPNDTIPTTYGGSTFGSTFGDWGYAPFSGSASPRASFAPLPEFNAPRFEAPPPFVYNKQFTAPTFAAPTAQDLSADPSFQFRLDQGRKALEQSAAGKGVLRTGGTLKDLVNYGQNFASNEYGNVYTRKFNEFKTDYDNKFNEYKFDYDKEADTYARNYGVTRDVFDRNYKAAYDEFAPKLMGWQTNANADQRAAEAQFNREWDMYNSDRQTSLQRYLADRQFELDKYKTVLNSDEP